VHRPDSDLLYTLVEDVDGTGPLDVPRDLVLVHHLAGFVDAGSAASSAVEALLGGHQRVDVARFDADALLDHRSRRPVMHFDTDRWTGYDAPHISVSLLRRHDDPGQALLLLHGLEPDYRWEAFTASVLHLVRHLGVRLVVGLAAIPMGVPHTRPAGVITHGTRAELVRGRRAWVGQVRVPGNVGGLLELRLGEAGVDAMAFTVNVPHYVAASEYPDAAAVLLDGADARRHRRRGRQERRGQRRRVGPGGAVRQPGGVRGCRPAQRPARRRRAGGGARAVPRQERPGARHGRGERAVSVRSLDAAQLLSVPLARRLREAGLRWEPTSGDRFVLADRDMDADVFVVSDMVADVHQFPSGPVIGFNGTVEWALDSVGTEQTLWLPAEVAGRRPAARRPLGARGAGRQRRRGLRAGTAEAAGARRRLSPGPVSPGCGRPATSRARREAPTVQG
jgi:hypothetical protein